MWRRIVPLLLALSLGMNLALLAVWCLRGGVCGNRPCPAEGECRGLHTYLGAREAQRNVLGHLNTQFRERALPIRCEIDAHRSRLLDLLEAQDPDSQAMAAERAAILDGQGRMQALVIEQILAEKAVLDSVQQKSFFELLRSRPGCMGATVAGCDSPAEAMQVGAPVSDTRP